MCINFGSIFVGFLIDFVTPSRTESLFLVLQVHRFWLDFGSISGSILDGRILGRATPIEENGLFWFFKYIEFFIDFWIDLDSLVIDQSTNRYHWKTKKGHFPR